MLDSFRRVETTKGITFYAPPGEVFSTDENTIGALYVAGHTAGMKNARICLHADSDALYQNMLILEWKGSYFPPHRHSTKPESLVILEHALDVFIFDDAGNILQRENLVYTGITAGIYIPANCWHCTVPMDNYVVYQETKPGPFLGEADREFAPWAANLTFQDMVERLKL